MKRTLNHSRPSIAAFGVVLMTLVGLSGCGHSPRHVVTSLWRRDVADNANREHKQLRLPSIRRVFARNKMDEDRKVAASAKQSVSRVSIERLEPPRSKPPKRTQRPTKRRKSDRVIVADDPFSRINVEELTDQPQERVVKKTIKPEPRANKASSESLVKRQEEKQPAFKLLPNPKRELKLLPDEKPTSSDSFVGSAILLSSKQRSSTKSRPTRTEWFLDDSQEKNLPSKSIEAEKSHRSLPDLALDRQKSKSDIDKLIRESRQEMSDAGLSELVHDQEPTVDDNTLNSSVAHQPGNSPDDGVVNLDSTEQPPTESTVLSRMPDFADDGSDILIVASEQIPSRLEQESGAATEELVSLQPELEHADTSESDSLINSTKEVGEPEFNESDLTQPEESPLRLMPSQSDEQVAMVDDAGDVSSAIEADDSSSTVNGPVIPPSLLPQEDFDPNLITSSEAKAINPAQPEESLATPNWDIEPVVEPVKESRFPWMLVLSSAIVVLVIATVFVRRRNTNMEAA